MTKEGAPQPSASSSLRDLVPLLVFFVVNGAAGIYWATGAFMVATVVAAGHALRTEGRVPPMMIFTLVVVVLFGGLTLALGDDTFIKLKVTVLNVLFGSILLVGLALGKPYLKLLMGQAFHLTDRGWSLLTVRYACFFLFLAAVNEVVWRNVSTDTWVTFKVFGLLGLTLVFSLLQIPLLQKHAPQEAVEPVEEG